MNRLIRLYPATWRERYGDEFDQLVHDLRLITPRWRLAVDLIRGAADAHINARLGMQATDRAAFKRAALIATIVWLGLSVEVYFSNVAFPSVEDDDGVSVLVSYLCVFAALFITGVAAARAGAGRRAQVLAGALAGAMIGLLTIGTFAVVDNVWLDIVSQQQTKIDGLAGSGGTSMRAYINSGLRGAAIFLTVMLGIFGAGLSLLGGFAGGKRAA